MSSLAGCLKKLNSLKNITLHFYCYWQHDGINDLGLLALSRALKNQTCLQNIDLDFSSYSLAEEII